MINIIAAIDRNGLIGNGNKLPWHYKEDMQWFREQTIGSVVIMGRKTYETLPNKGLDRRVCYILTRDNYFIPRRGVPIADKQEIIQKANMWKLLHGLDTYIIGGAQIYKELLDIADRLLITHIDKEFEGDIYFPINNFDNYEKNIIKESGDLTFVEYLKKGENNEN